MMLKKHAFKLIRNILLNLKFISIIVIILLINALIRACFKISSKKNETFYHMGSSVYNDHNVTTIEYLNDYKLFTHKISSLKQIYNSQNSDIKTINLYNRAFDTLNKTNYSVVVYTNVFYERKFCEFDQDMYLNECPYKNCKFTCEKSKIYSADALLFSEFDLYAESIEDRIFLKKTLGRHSGRHKQIWILWNDEVKRYLKLHIL